jgi:hypothetical protein
VEWGAGPNDVLALVPGADAVIGTGGVPGEFSIFAIQQANGTNLSLATPDWFDAVAVTQAVIPDPSTCLLVLGGISMMMLYVRRLSRKIPHTA